MNSGQVEQGEEIHDSDYSEWSEGPSLITRSWLYEAHPRLRETERPYMWHRHYRGQLLCIESGLIRVKTDAGTWVLPPHRAGWIPPGAMHSVSLCSTLKGRSVLFTPDVCSELPALPCVIGISDLLGVLVQRTAGWSKTGAMTAEQQHILSVIIDEIRCSPHESLYLPMPKDPRLERVAQGILDDPGRLRTVDEWAIVGSVSARTLRRLMRAETGMSFREWQQQAQLTHALEMLARGVSVMAVADALGYATPSNFIAMFRRAFGDSPAHYFSSRQL